METVVIVPDNVVSVLEQFNTSKEGIEKFSSLLIKEVYEGNIDPLKVALFMKTLDKIKDIVNERLGARYVVEASKYGDKPFNHLGAEISIGEAGINYDYSTCNHPGWNELTSLIDNATKQRKEYEATLKTLKEPMTMIHEDEVVTVNPPFKKSKEVIKISIK